MSLPANQVPFYLIKSLSAERHLSPAIDKLLVQLKAIDPMTQRNSMNQVRYVGNAGIYESVLAPVAFGKEHDLVLLGKRLYKVSEDDVKECDDKDQVEAKFVGLCEAFANSNISEDGSLSITDRFNNVVEINENAEGDHILTVNKNTTVAVKDGWEQELLGMQVEPRAVTLVGSIMENLENIVSMDNIMSISSAGGAGYSMFFIKQGKNNHIVIADPTTDSIAIQKKVSVKEAIDTAFSTFGTNIENFFEGKSVKEDMGKVDDEMNGIKEEMDECMKSIEEINKQPEDVQNDPKVVEAKKALEERGQELMKRHEELMGQAAIA